MRHIIHFVAVAEELHFRQAAEKLNISQPVLSRSVQHLENQLDLVLLERSNRNVRLTEAGQIFLKGCQSTLQTMEKTIVNTCKTSKGEMGQLCIGYTDFAISGKLPKILKEFGQTYPGITMELVHGFTNQQLKLLENGELDFGFITGPLNMPEFETHIVQRDQYVAVLYNKHPLARQSTVKLSQLAKERFIMGTPTGWQYFNDHIYRICRKVGFSPNIVQYAFNSEGIFGLVACEMGIAIHTSCVANYLRKGLVYRLIDDVDKTALTLAVWKDDANFPARAHFKKFLQTRAFSSQ